VQITWRVEVIYRFNKIEVNLNKFEIRTNDNFALVEPKVFDLIVYLIKNRQRLVSREELFEQIWSGREVSDTTLSNHIKSARKILGDNGNLQKVIKTVRSRGYQFTADVEEILESPRIISEVISDTSSNQKHVSVNNHSTLFNSKIINVIFFLFVITLVIWALNTFKQVQQSPPYLLVVPFSISSHNDVALEPFADQMTRELMQGLRKVSGIRIVPPPSSFTFKDNKRRSHIKEQLPTVNYVIDGIVSEDSEGNVRVTVELEDINNGQLLWDDDFDIQINSTNRFSLQNKISSSVSESLKVVILEEEKQVLAEVPTRNIQAYDAYVLGQYQLSIMTHDSVLRSIDFFTQAIAIDSNFEAAYIAKANAYRVLMTLFEQPKKVLPKVMSSAIDVLKINPESPQIMSLLGVAYIHAWQWEDAWEMLSKAREKDPTIALTELGFALYYSAMGDATNVKKALQNADTLDPLNLEIADWGGWALMMVNELDAAIEWGNQKVKLHPELPYPLLNLSIAHYMKGNYEKGMSLATQGVNLSQRAPLPLVFLAQSYAAAGQKMKALTLFSEAEAQNQYMCPYESAIVYILLEDIDKAFSFLDQAVEFKSNCLIFTKNDPRLNSLKHEVRYKELLEKIALDDESINKLSH
jgi:DNA-binding winged helix-turn-helix (wHTH) protein/TolB-like protein/Tfp pilus assembly protein PilF